MTRSKATAIALFVSLGVNVFLLGLVTMRVLGTPPPPPHHAPTGHHEQTERHAEAQNHAQTKRPAPAGPRPPKSGKRDRDKSDADPHDVRILRKMIQVMGGRKDPRVREFWKKTQEDTRATKTSLKEARKVVEEKLMATPFVKADLEQALAELSKQTSASQLQAQAALVELATLLTDEERARLQAVPGPDRREERK